MQSNRPVSPHFEPFHGYEAVLYNTDVDSAHLVAVKECKVSP